MEPNALLALCFVFHLCYFLSIFDIYFRSPIDTGLPPTHDGLAAEVPAKRVVLLVADGLRADTCFRFMGRDARYHEAQRGEMDAREANYQADAQIWPRNKTSFLRQVVEEQGVWGVSHTRVPTESRPGHVAVIAGFYEDVSAVTRGWQDNPVEFDHVFNQSRRTWLWGSPDITRMFAKRHPHVTDWFYSAEDENFAASDLTILDTWVFNKVAELFHDAELNATLRAEMHQDRVFFFLHLLGLDSNGHAYRPHAPEYYLNMAHVDKGVQGVEQLFREHFKDDATAFVFTADHGMGNQGAHGDGDPTNTRTPLIAWGAGVRKPERRATSDPRGGINTGFSAEEEFAFSRNWGLDHLARTDVEQADVAPLLATLVGIPNPVNSVGRLPSDLLEHSRYSALSLLRNARQLVRQVAHKEEVRRARQLFLRPFEPLRAAATRLDGVEASLMTRGETSEEAFAKARAECEAAMATAIDGLHYYQVYDRPYLMAIIVSGYLGWICLLAVQLSASGAEVQGAEWTGPAVAVALLTVVLLAYQALEQSPIMYHVYVLFSGAFWAYVLRKPRLWASWATKLRERPRDAAQLAAYMAGTQLLVLGYTYRYIYVLLFLALACWPAWIPCVWGQEVVCYPSHTGVIKRLSGRALAGAWSASCAALGCFTLLPLDMKDSAALLFLGGALLFAMLLVFFSKDLDGVNNQRKAQLGLLAAAVVLTLHTDQKLRAKEGLPRVNQLLSAAVALVAPHLCLFSSPTPYKRYLAIVAGLGTVYVFLSINYEVLFFACLAFALLQWLVLERAIFYNEAPARKKQAAGENGGGDDSVSMGDLRTAFIFLLMVHIAFFGTGNIASMSSFQLSATYRFVTVFSPFLMGALCILAKLVPYLLVTAHVSMVAAERRAAGVSTVSPQRVFFLVIALYDLLAVHLFFWVRDEGSWLEIGNSISQFGLVNAQCIFLPLLFGISSYFLRGVAIEGSPVAAKAK